MRGGGTNLAKAIRLRDRFIRRSRSSSTEQGGTDKTIAGSRLAGAILPPRSIYSGSHLGPRSDNTPDKKTIVFSR